MFAPSHDSDVFDNLLITYAFLFHSASGFDDALSEYNKLDPPTWMSSMNISLSQLTKDRPLIGDTRYHLKAYENRDQHQFTGENTNLMRYDSCGVFENRVRILKTWMDQQKPSGLIALWRDKRDSGQWYTFWLVLIVGGISIILSLASLAASIAQAVASFEALNIQVANNSAQSNSTGRIPAHLDATLHST